ncbi:hypothetical protein Q0590_23045 [Rhodocytophaga aerolata]|uniref:Uncharacterized protein n=1 Tax=Rhodocytophaga aerolata TaxID=455078 RepID=A0ABT8REM9_9BACT|nr:hypothetical protein [Rhodocytophaga aerolata]MDO1449172.1 hypothetical protein [Rhodocytophaga aerolata]
MFKNKLLYALLLIIAFIIGYTVNEIFSEDNSVSINTNTKPSYVLFEPNYNVAHDQLLKENFEQSHRSDNYELEKKLGEKVTVTYWIDYPERLILNETWIIRFDTFDINKAIEYITDKEGFIITDICPEKPTAYNFFVFGSNSDLYFDCSFVNKNDINNYYESNVLIVGHRYPAYARGGIMKNHKRFQQ